MAPFYWSPKGAIGDVSWRYWALNGTSRRAANVEPAGKQIVRAQLEQGSIHFRGREGRWGILILVLFSLDL